MNDQALVTIDMHHGNKRVLINGEDCGNAFAALQLHMDAGHALLTAQLNPDVVVVDLPCHVQVVNPEQPPRDVIAKFLAEIDPAELEKSALDELGSLDDDEGVMSNGEAFLRVLMRWTSAAGG